MKANNITLIINRLPQARAVCHIAIGCLMLLAATFAYAALADARVVRVTAADITKLPARQNYVADLRKSNVAYDLDGTAQAIDWNRILIREADRDEGTLTAYLREHSPSSAKRTPTRLVFGAQGGVQKALGFKASPNPGTEYKCGKESKICSCSGGADCEVMLLSKACKGTAVCGLEEGSMYCDCEAK